MIELLVTGQTYHNRDRLKRMGYRWDPIRKGWSKLVAEASLNSTIEYLRPENVPWDMRVTLRGCDVHGKSLYPETLTIKLAMQDAEREPVDYGELFCQTITTSFVRPSPEKLSSLQSPRDHGKGSSELTEF